MTLLLGKARTTQVYRVFVPLMWFCCVALPQVRAADDASKESDAAFWNKELKPFLAKYCSDCHTGEEAEAGIDFTQYGEQSDLGRERPRWNQVRGLIKLGAMPPPDHDPLPSLEEREKIAGWIDQKANYVDCGLVHNAGRVTLRRLNSVEYDNTLRDILGIDFSPSSLIGFPSDGVGNGFDNQGDVLTLSPLQLEKYLQAAQLVASRVIVLDRDVLRDQRQDGDLIFEHEKATAKFQFADGDYSLRIRMEYGDKEKETVPVALLVDGEEVDRWDVGQRKSTFEVDKKMTAGWHELTVHFVDDPNTERRGDYNRRVAIEYIGIRGPEGGEPPLPEAHQRLFRAYPGEGKTVEQAATEIFRPLVRLAYRREPEPLELQRVVQLVGMAVEQGESFEQAVGFGLQSILVSPQFLFRIEGEPVKPGNQPIDQYALATRLAYFLWASGPDEALLDLASEGKLRERAVLDAQLKRMLADPRSESLVTRFFAQYLGLGNLKEADPDKEQFPLFNDRMRAAMQRETELFCLEMVRGDLSLAMLLQGDFTFINPRLAELYGMEFEGEEPEDLYRQGPGLPLRRYGSERDGRYLDDDKWVRVSLPDQRRGILTHASILTLTSNPARTSPVKRGKFILESILGDPPPAAPPNVPTFEETKKEHADLSLRQQLEIHRANPSCASCHRVMDPLGLGFENYDAIGKWRERDGKHPIDAGGELADGSKFKGSAELVTLLEARMPEIARNFAEKLLTYALGRGLEPYDNCAVQSIVASAAANDYKFSSFVQSIVVSEPFGNKQVTAENKPLLGSND